MRRACCRTCLMPAHTHVRCEAGVLQLCGCPEPARPKGRKAALPLPLRDCARRHISLPPFFCLQNKPVEAYRNTFANLALPLFAMAEPIPPKASRDEIGARATRRSAVFAAPLGHMCRVSVGMPKLHRLCADWRPAGALLQATSAAAVLPSPPPPRDPHTHTPTPLPTTHPRSLSSTKTWSGACGTGGSWRET